MAGQNGGSPKAGAVAILHHVTDIRCMIGTKVGSELSVPQKVDIGQVTVTTTRKMLDFLTFLHSKFRRAIKILTAFSALFIFLIIAYCIVFILSQFYPYKK